MKSLYTKTPKIYGCFQAASAILPVIYACISAAPHRPAYGTDGDYFSKPNAEDIFETVYGIMHESDPEEYPMIY